MGIKKYKIYNYKYLEKRKNKSNIVNADFWLYKIQVEYLRSSLIQTVIFIKYLIISML